MDKTAARIARALAQERPSTLEGSTTRPRLTAEEELWTNIALGIDTELRANGNDTTWFLTERGVFGDRLDGQLFTWEVDPDDAAKVNTRQMGRRG